MKAVIIDTFWTSTNSSGTKCSPSKPPTGHTCPTPVSCAWDPRHLWIDFIGWLRLWSGGLDQSASPSSCPTWSMELPRSTWSTCGTVFQRLNNRCHCNACYYYSRLLLLSFNLLISFDLFANLNNSLALTFFFRWASTMFTLPTINQLTWTWAIQGSITCVPAQRRHWKNSW